MIMRFLIAAALALPVGCDKQQTERTAQPTSGLITTFGEHEVTGTTWTVSVSADRFMATRAVAHGGVGGGPQRWSPGPGWFAFVSSDTDVWLWSGGQLLLIVGDEEGIHFFDPHAFPKPVPNEVLERLPAEVRDDPPSNPRE